MEKLFFPKFFPFCYERLYPPRSFLLGREWIKGRVVLPLNLCRFAYSLWPQTATHYRTIKPYLPTLTQPSTSKGEGYLPLKFSPLSGSIPIHLPSLPGNGLRRGWLYLLKLFYPLYFLYLLFQLLKSLYTSYFAYVFVIEYYPFFSKFYFKCKSYSLF